MRELYKTVKYLLKMDARVAAVAAVAAPPEAASERTNGREWQVLQVLHVRPLRTSVLGDRYLVRMVVVGDGASDGGAQ